MEARSLVEEGKFEVRPAKSISTHMIVATMLAIYSSASILYPSTMPVFDAQWHPAVRHYISIVCLVLQAVALASSIGTVYIQLFLGDVDEADSDQSRHPICRKCSCYGHQTLALAFQATAAGTLLQIVLGWGLLTFSIVACGFMVLNLGLMFRLLNNIK